MGITEHEDRSRKGGRVEGGRKVGPIRVHVTSVGMCRNEVKGQPRCGRGEQKCWQDRIG